MPESRAAAPRSLWKSDAETSTSWTLTLGVKTKPGKLRPAVVLQSDLVNESGDPSTIVIPTTTRLIEESGMLRFRIKKGEGGLTRDSDLLLGQLIAAANESFRKEIGLLPVHLMDELEQRVRIILALQFAAAR